MARVVQSDKLSFQRYVDNLQLNPSQALVQVVKPRGMAATGGMKNPTNIVWDIRSVGRNALLDSKIYIRWVLEFEKRVGGVGVGVDKINDRITLKDGLPVQQSMTDMTMVINGVSHSVNQQDFLKPFLLQQGRKQFEKAFQGTGGELDDCKEDAGTVIISEEIAPTAVRLNGDNMVLAVAVAIGDTSVTITTTGDDAGIALVNAIRAGTIRYAIASNNVGAADLTVDRLPTADGSAAGAGAGNTYVPIIFNGVAHHTTAANVTIVAECAPVKSGIIIAQRLWNASAATAVARRIGAGDNNVIKVVSGESKINKKHYKDEDKIRERRRSNHTDLRKFEFKENSNDNQTCIKINSAGVQSIIQLEIWEPICFPAIGNPFKGADPRCFDSRSPYTKYSSVIPNFNNCTLSCNFQEVVESMITIDNLTEGALVFNAIQRADLHLNWYQPPPSSKFQYPTNINLQSYSSQIYKKAVIGAPAYNVTSTEQNSDYLRLDSIPNYFLWYIEKARDPSKYASAHAESSDNKDRYPRIDAIDITINAKHNTLQTNLQIREIYEIYKRKFRYNDNVPYNFEEWSQKRCIISLTDEDMALVMGANIQNPTNITFKITYTQTSHPNSPGGDEWNMVFLPIYTNEYLTITPKPIEIFSMIGRVLPKEVLVCA